MPWRSLGRLTQKGGLIALVPFILAGCTSSESNPANLSPTAVAGVNQVVNEQTLVHLNGTASSDADGQLTNYFWSQIEGPSVTLTGANSATSSFTAPTLTDPTDLTFRLFVLDDSGATGRSDVTIRVMPVNTEPTAHAGSAQGVSEQSLVTLTGVDSSDSDGDLVAYQWVQIAGAEVPLVDAQALQAHFTAPVLTAPADLVFRLTVTDNEGASDSAEVVVSVSPVNVPPVARAGSAQRVSEQSQVQLDGRASSDSDGSVLAYAWSQSGGTVVTLVGSDSATPSFVAPTLTAPADLTFQLLVTDNEGASSSDQVTISVDPVNATPVASAGADVTADELAQVTLDGRGSVDSDGQITSYTWRQTSGPSVTLNGADTAQPGFLLPALTDVVTLGFELTVVDNEGASDTASVTVFAVPLPSLSVSAVTTAEGDSGTTMLTFTVTLSALANGVVTVDYTTVDGTATAGSDYTAVTGTLTFNAGETSAMVDVTLLGDMQNEGDETLLLTLSNPSANAKLASPANAIGTIANDDIHAHPLNDTGIAFGGNYPNGNNGNCTGHNIAQQDCSSGRDVTHNDSTDGFAGFSYTKLDRDGTQLPAEATTWYCILDNVTGRVWESKVAGGSETVDRLHNPDDTYTWFNSDPNRNGGTEGYADYAGDTCYGYQAGEPSTYCNTEAYVARVNALGWCGAQDWRMPTREELLGLVNYNRTYYSIDPDWFPDTDHRTWSGTPYSSFWNGAWVVSFEYGKSGYGYRYQSNEVRLVRDTP